MDRYYHRGFEPVLKRGIKGLNKQAESILFGEAFGQPPFHTIADPVESIGEATSTTRQVTRPGKLWGWNPMITFSISSNIPDWGFNMIIQGFEEIRKYAYFRAERMTADNHTAMIRIYNAQDTGSWSYVGVDNLFINKSYQTMNLSTLTDKEPAHDSDDYRYTWYTILHEICHMLGLKHEQSNPLRPFSINIQQIMIDTGMSEDHVKTVYDDVDPVDSQALSPFDPKSIMLYPLTKGWIHPDPGTPSDYPMNYELSAADKGILTTLLPEVIQDTPIRL